MQRSVTDEEIPALDPPPHIAPARYGSYPLRDGNAVRPWIDGVPAFRAIAAAVEAARSSVWVTVAFLDEELLFPDAYGGFFELLERAAARGLDVRVLFWSEPEIETLIVGSAHFPAGQDSFRVLSERAPSVLARWDRLRGYCHHQKSWLIDAAGSGRGSNAGEVAFVGGINLDHDSMASPGHPPAEGRAGGGDSVHDVYLEVRGPAATDVHHNFVQRWNEASEREHPFGAFPSLALADDLDFPETASAPAGSALVQVARTVQPGVYRVGVASPGALPFAIRGGEFSILEQYLSAIDGARSSIYLENQMLLCPDLLRALGAALERGVDVVALLPVRAMPELRKVRWHPVLEPVFASLEGLAAFDNFTLAAPAANSGPGLYADIYVHAKVAIVDDAWFTVGSANAMFRSFQGDTEMNVSCWDRPAAAELRIALFAEHLGEDTSACSDREALARYRRCALDNRERRARGEAMRGQVFAFEPGDWAASPETGIARA